MATSHRDLIVWQKALDLAVVMYKLAETLPVSETYAMRAQLTRAAASVAANIAEGNARGTRKEYAKFVGISKGSLMEAETYLMLAVRLGYVREVNAQPLFAQITEISKMLTALRRKLLESAP